MTTVWNVEPGARWLRCDLHVHTPFDREKRFGEDIRGAIEALKNAKPQRLADIADRFVDACRSAAEGAGMDVVALTDHNSIDGYRYLTAQFDTLARQAKDRNRPMPAILPGVEFSVGGERPIHFLVIFASDTDPDDIDHAITHVVRESGERSKAPQHRTSTMTWLGTVRERVGAARQAAAVAFRGQVDSLRAQEKTIAQEQSEQWQVEYDQARSDYEDLRKEMIERGVDFEQHEKLLQRRAQVEREVASLRSMGEQRNEIESKIRKTRLRLVETHEARLVARREQAQSLEVMDADVRLEILPFRDREDFQGRREQWFGGAGLQERDWTVLCN